MHTAKTVSCFSLPLMRIISYPVQQMSNRSENFIKVFENRFSELIPCFSADGLSISAPVQQMSNKKTTL